MKHILLAFGLTSTFFIGFAQKNWSRREELIFNNAPFKECHASSIVEISPKELMVSFFAGSRESNKDVCIWLTRKIDDEWSEPYIIAEGIINDSTRFPCWNPVLFKSKIGRLYLFYKVGPNPRDWWGMVRTSTDNGKTWTKAERLPERILGPIKNKPVQLTDGTILCPSSIETENSWKVRMETYLEASNVWKAVFVDSASSSKIIQPAILTHSDKKLQILCRSNQNKIVSAWSNDNGNSWGNFSVLHLPNPNSGIDAVTLKSNIQLLVYNPTIRGKDWFYNREKLNVALSRDGINWKDIAILENGISGSTEEFSYPAVIQTNDGNVHITYTYNRKSIKHVTLAPPLQK